MANLRSGQKLRELREQANKSREWIAVQSSVSTSTIARWELSGKVPNIEAVTRIAATLAVSSSELLELDALETAGSR